MGWHSHRDGGGSLPLKPIPLSLLHLPIDGEKKPRFRNVVKKTHRLFYYFFFLAGDCEVL